MACEQFVRCMCSAAGSACCLVCIMLKLMDMNYNITQSVGIIIARHTNIFIANSSDSQCTSSCSGKNTASANIIEADTFAPTQKTAVGGMHSSLVIDKI